MPAELATFVLEDWAEPVDRPDPSGFYRYSDALDRWIAARSAWEQETGWEGDLAWWQAQHDAIAAMPYEPWDPSLI